MLHSYLRRAGALVGPLVFSVGGGHLLSAVTSRSVDALGQPIPWYTYPAVDFLKGLDLKAAKVAEFGSGNSTLWWAQHAGEVLALESDAQWFESISKKTAGMRHVEVKHVSSPAEARAYLKPDYYDVIIVDDGSGAGPKGRPVNADTAFDYVKESGIVIVDNSDTSYSSNGHYPIIEMAKDKGLRRIDFMGHAAGSSKRSCTSFFFHEEVNLFSNLKPPHPGQVRRAA